MFEAFQRSEADRQSRKRVAASFGAAALTYGLIGVALAVFARSAVSAPEDRLIEVTFERALPKKVDIPPPPPPPPPPKRITKGIAPPPMKVLVAPKEMPTEAPDEADPGNKIGIAGDGIGDPYGTAGGVAAQPVAVAAPPPPPPPPPPPKRKLEAINLPEEATPPEPSASNQQPAYPEAARAAGMEGQVILKIVISETGKVASVEVMRGEPPFVDAAVAAVKTWSYEPATLDGKPIAVFRILKVPFRLSVGG